MNALPQDKYIKNFTASEIKASDSDSRTLVVTISTPTPDRSCDTVQPLGMDAANYMKNPVVQFAHKYDEPPIAKCINLKSTDSGVIATVEFPQQGLYDKADTIYEMYKQGFLNAWSIGFMPKQGQYEPNDLGGYDFKQWELFEFSSVPVPDNPQALTIMRSKGINVDLVIRDKGVITYKETPKAAVDEKWDAGEQEKAATVDDLKVMCAWFDSDNADNKSAYKLPHHDATGEHAVVWNGVKAAGDALQGSRGGVDIPDGDIAGVKAHLAKHYEEFSQTPPWGKDEDDKSIGEHKIETKESKDDKETKITDLTVLQLKELISHYSDKHLESKDVDEVVSLGYILSELQWLVQGLQFDGVSQSTLDKVNQAIMILMEAVSEQAVLGQKTYRKSAELIKAGRTISSKHEDMLSDAKSHMTKAMDSVQSVLDAVQPPANDTEDDEDENDEKSIDNDILKDFYSPTKEVIENDENILETLTWKGGDN